MDPVTSTAVQQNTVASPVSGNPFTSQIDSHRIDSQTEAQTGLLGGVVRASHAKFRVWAPNAQTVEVVIEAPTAQRLPLRGDADGYFSGAVPGLEVGALYKYSVDGTTPSPDPCSRFQPAGPHGPSMLTDPSAYGWHDADWPGVDIKGQVIYELHVGAFTPEGTFEAARERLPWLRDLGVTLLEILPIAECPGRWNWGYDGVQLYAPYHVYGHPDTFKHFIDSAHQLGLAVILDVVYNHLGPDGNYLKYFSRAYFSTRHYTDWGEALNFDAEQAGGVRDFVIGNACYWAEEFHLDGFRLDATQSIFDTGQPHVLAELSRRVREQTAPRRLVIIAENEPQRGEQLRPVDQGGFGLDAMWNDDFHHSARVALTGTRDGYFCDYTGRAQELLSCVRRGFLFQGQYYGWQRQPRGSPLRGVPAWCCVHFIQNHDQVGNTFIGDRLHAFTSPARYRALTALLLLGPQTPLLFMGQEFLSTKRFMYFADHRAQLGPEVLAGRRRFLSQFRAYADPASQAAIRDPAAEATFRESQLDWSEAATHGDALMLHHSLLQLRRQDSTISQQRLDCLDGATLSEHALVLRWFDDTHGDRLLVVNLDVEMRPGSLAEPLLAPPLHQHWSLLWASEDPRFGGSGIIDPVTEKGQWRIPANSAVLLQACRPGIDP